ncbi:MAG: 3-mercaptopyruvate sulfurtransferase [Ahrensia sp.]|nr:3-mercaptopyruvate sulfurtransferase [Ahrensia sp.]
MSEPSNPYLVSCDWLAGQLGNPDVSIVDSSWYLPTMLMHGVPRDGRAEYDAQHIPGAVYFDINDVVEPGSDLPHTLAPSDVFAEKAGALGIADTNTIVVYDGMGLFSAPRVWWNFRVMGAAKVVILDGGLPAWIAQRLPIEAGTAPVSPRLFKAKFDESAVTTFGEMSRIVKDASVQIADARPADRFAGTAPEPRPGIRSGHMPGAYSVPFSELATDGRLKSAEELRRVFEDAQIDLNKPIVTSCGSGVTAAALTLALETVGHSRHTLYDGSWAEWGGADDTPVVTGE